MDYKHRTNRNEEYSDSKQQFADYTKRFNPTTLGELASAVAKTTAVQLFFAKFDSSYLFGDARSHHYHISLIAVHLDRSLASCIQLLASHLEQIIIHKAQ